MKPPSSVVVGPYTYSVVVDEAAVHAASYEEGRPLSGISDHAAQTIALHPDLGPDALADILLHEVLHAELAQLDHNLPRDVEERIVTYLGAHLLDTLRRNPQLVEFLTGADRPTRASGRSRHGRTDGRKRASTEGP